MVTYAVETMTLISQDEDRLSIFETMVIRRTLGSKKLENEGFQKLMNFEVKDILNG